MREDMGGPKLENENQGLNITALIPGRTCMEKHGQPGISDATRLRQADDSAADLRAELRTRKET